MMLECLIVASLLVGSFFCFHHQGNINLCYENGGVFNFEEIDGLSFFKCSCPYPKFGKYCQYSCESYPEECVKELKHNEECKSLLVRQPSAVPHLAFANRTYQEYTVGFSDDGTDCSTFPENPHDGECWLGFNELYEFIPDTSTKFATMRVSVSDGSHSFSTECYDVVHERVVETDSQIQLLAPYKDILRFGGCFNHDSPLSYPMSRINGMEFSTVDVKRDYSEESFEESCARIYGGGWWYVDCTNMHGTGPYDGIYEGTPYPAKYIEARGIWVEELKYWEEIGDLTHFRIDICRYGCPDGWYGERCDLQCPEQCEANGGTCKYIHNIDGLSPDGDAQSVSRIECECPPGRFGRVCSYKCDETLNLSQCISTIDTSDTEELVMLVNYEGFIYPSYEEFKIGWGWDTGEVQGEPSFAGLETLHIFSPFESQRPTSITFNLKYDFDGDIRYFTKTCFDVVFKGEEFDYQMHLAGEAYCVGDAEISSSDILYHSQVGFSVDVHDVDLHEEKNVAIDGGWWHRRELRMNPAGNIESRYPLYFRSVSEVVKPEWVKIILLRYPCIEGSFGTYCNVVCPSNYCQNGGTCNKIGSPAKGIPGVQCLCAPGFFGKYCQYKCEHGDLERCLKFDVNAGKECSPLVIRSGDDSVIFDKLSSDYENGFGSVDSDYWHGLDKTVEFLNRKKQENDFSTIHFTVESSGKTYKKTCFDLSIGSKAEGYEIDFGQCFGDSQMWDRNIHFMKRSKFSTADKPYSGHDCGKSLHSGWWYYSEDCHEIHPTGKYSSENPKERLRFMSLNGEFSVSEFRIDVCNSYIKVSEEAVVIHEQDNVDFNQNLREFSEGIGNCSIGDCFNSLDYISEISNKFMWLDMVFDVGYEGISYEASCKALVEDKTAGYRLHFKPETCVRDERLSLSDILYHNNMEFSTNNQCSVDNECAWWFNDCYQILPTGKFGQNMRFQSLSQYDSVSRFNVKMRGNIKDKAGNIFAEELRGPKCKKILSRKKDGGLSFRKGYPQYVSGFGDCKANEECWIGLDDLHQMTKTPKKLFIDVEHRNKHHTLACLDFTVDDANNEYVFDLTTCYGSAALSREMLRKQIGKPFSTIDHQLQGHTYCAGNTKSGWWYDDSCGGVLPTGTRGIEDEDGVGIHYESITGLSEDAASFEMSICGVFEEDIDTLGCKTFLSRTTGDLSFDRTYSEYVQGFGDPLKGEGWLGLDALYKMTDIPQKLEIKYTHDGEEGEINCGIFFVEGAENEYKLHVEYCEENDISDQISFVPDFTYHNGARFSTFDHPSVQMLHDSDQNCGIETNAGFWYRETGDCHKFHPTGEYGISDDSKRGINLGSLKGLDSVSMMICQLREKTAKNQQFSHGVETRACYQNCEEYIGKSFELKRGEQMYMFEEKNYISTDPNSKHAFLDVHIGPKKLLTIHGSTKSFYTSIVSWPVIFEQQNFNYYNIGGTSRSQLMYIKETCMERSLCGWGNKPIGSVFVPKGFKLTFYDMEFKDINDQTQMYVIGGNDYDESMTFSTKAWLYQIEEFDEAVKYPILFEDVLFTQTPVELKYDCPENCGVGDHRSLQVPSDYVVEFFSSSNFEGISRKFIGPIHVEYIDGFFGEPTNQIQSYTSRLSTIVGIEIRDIVFDTDNVGTDTSTETNVNEIVVDNPTGTLREVSFRDTYIVYSEKSWSDFNSTSEERYNKTTTGKMTEEFLQITATANIGYELTFKSETNVEVRSPFAYSQDTVSVSTAVRVGGEVTLGYGYTHVTRSGTVTELKWKQTQTNTTGGLTSTSEEKAFLYQCIALPYTRTTCQAKQIKGVYNIPYNATKVIIFSDGTIEEESFQGVIVNSIATQVYFIVSDAKIKGFCQNDFVDFKDECYKGVKMAHSSAVDELYEGMKSPNDINYLPISHEEGLSLCYREEGSQITSVHSTIENYHVHNVCDFSSPVLIGVKYIANTDQHVNVDGSPFDYSRFPPDTQRPAQDSYVVINELGKWEYVEGLDSPFADCVVCKKKMDEQHWT